VAPQMAPARPALFLPILAPRFTGELLLFALLHNLPGRRMQSGSGSGRTTPPRLPCGCPLLGRQLSELVSRTSCGVACCIQEWEFGRGVVKCIPRALDTLAFYSLPAPRRQFSRVPAWSIGYFREKAISSSGCSPLSEYTGRKAIFCAPTGTMKEPLKLAPASSNHPGCGTLST